VQESCGMVRSLLNIFKESINQYSISQCSVAGQHRAEKQEDKRALIFPGFCLILNSNKRMAYA
jgi:hypothetical protein